MRKTTLIIAMFCIVQVHSQTTVIRKDAAGVTIVTDDIRFYYNHGMSPNVYYKSNTSIIPMEERRAVNLDIYKSIQYETTKTYMSNVNIDDSRFTIKEFEEPTGRMTLCEMEVYRAVNKGYKTEKEIEDYINKRNNE